MREVLIWKIWTGSPEKEVEAADVIGIRNANPKSVGEREKRKFGAIIRIDL